MTSPPDVLTPEQRSDILTREITRRTAAGRTALLAVRPFTAYLRTGRPLTRTWPLVLAVHVLWALAVVLVAFLLFRVVAVLVLLALIWWLPRNVTRVDVVGVGHHGEVTVETLYWRGAYKLERYLEDPANQ